MDHHKSGYAEAENDRGCDEGPTERAGRVKAAMAAEGYDDVPLKLGSVPAGEAATDLGHHGYFKQAAADSTQETAGGKYLSEQEYRHSTSQQIRRMLQRSGFNGLGYFYYPTYLNSSTGENYRHVPKVTNRDPTIVEFSGVRL